ncbi:PH domain-containing protein [Paenibacillus sp. FSL L8-0644]|uniref:PH domain-containing protein n=1 Tax=Paenibacillus TaxID=44249 RepID=UPI00298D1723|nr:PH domain-containing protein [Paenibacillus polymyxa]
MQTKEKELRAISLTLEAGEHIRSYMGCTYDLQQSSQRISLHGMLAVTSERIIFYSCTMGTPWVKFINYHHISLAKLDEDLSGTRGNITLINQGVNEVFTHLPSGEGIEGFVAVLEQEAGISCEN